MRQVYVANLFDGLTSIEFKNLKKIIAEGDVIEAHDAHEPISSVKYEEKELVVY